MGNIASRFRVHAIQLSLSCFSCDLLRIFTQSHKPHKPHNSFPYKKNLWGLIYFLNRIQCRNLICMTALIIFDIKWMNYELNCKCVDNFMISRVWWTFAIAWIALLYLQFKSINYASYEPLFSIWEDFNKYSQHYWF